MKMEKDHEGMVGEHHVEKETSSDEVPMYSPTSDKLGQSKDFRINEAADLYGDIHTAEEYGYVARGSVN